VYFIHGHHEHQQYVIIGRIHIHEEYESSNTVNDEGFDNIEPLVPTIGMCFECSDEAKTFYRQYAIRKGFGVRTRSSKKGSDIKEDTLF